MGYYTEYSLKIHGRTAGEAADFAKKHLLGDSEDWGPIEQIVNSKDWVSCYEERKWYEHADRMAEVSAEHPDLTISLYGRGEDDEDEWVMHFRAGKHVTHKRPRVRWMPPEPPAEWKE